jgi:predicted NAD-dependent protein-ADP-ribosyltransferase YbiA (DUF1768 family)
MSHSEDTILLFDPFSKLSPSYMYPMEMRGEKFSNIISYCYGGLVKPGGTRNYINNSNSKEGKTLALENFTNDQDDIYNQAVFNYLEHKYNKNSSFREELKNTGDTLIYPTDPYFAKLMSDFRAKIIKDDSDFIETTKRSGEQQKINYVHKAYNTLENLISTGKSDLEEFKGKTPEEIINILHLDIKGGSFERKNLSKAEIILLDHPTILVNILRKAYIDKYNLSAIEYNKDSIYLTYTENMVENKFGAKNKIKTMQEFTKSLSKVELQEVKNRLYDLWTMGVLIVPNSKIKKIFNKNEVEVLKSYVIPQAKNTPSPFKRNAPQMKNEYIIEEDSYHSPLHPYLIEIDGMLYPTVYHYVKTKLFSSFKGFRLVDAHNLIMINSNESSRDLYNYKNIGDLERDYAELRERHIHDILIERAISSLKNKFSVSNTQMSGLLVKSNPKELLYNDYSDFILGTGKITKNGYFTGENAIGKIMSEIRYNLIERGVQAIDETSITPTKNMRYFSDIVANKEELTWLYKKLHEIMSVQKREFDDRISCSKLLGESRDGKIPVDLEDYIRINGIEDKQTIIKIWNYITFLRRAVRMFDRFDTVNFTYSINKLEKKYRDLLVKKK